MYSGHLANTNNSKSLSNIFYVGRTLYLVYIGPCHQLHKHSVASRVEATAKDLDFGLKNQGRRLTSLPV